MATTWNEITIEQLDHVADQLKKVISQIADIEAQLMQANMKKVFAPWTATHVRHLGAIGKFASMTLSDLPDQIAAKKFGNKPRAQTEKERAAKDTARRKASAKQAK